jgi:hypothetical protein
MHNKVIAIEWMDMPYHEHLLRREYNHHYTFHSVYAYAPALAYSFHEDLTGYYQQQYFGFKFFHP